MVLSSIIVINKRKIIFFFFFIFNYVVKSQDLEPRAYANLPIKMNAVAVSYGYLKGNVLTEPSLPIADFTINSDNLGLGYIRTFGLANKLARIQVSLPVVFMAGKAIQTNGEALTGSRNGFADARIRFGINLIGSPALDKKDFSIYNQKTLVGFSLVTSVPTGLYYEDKRINIGTNRWGFKPEIGISKKMEHVYAEVYTGVWFYTKNNEYLVDKTLKQEPVFSVQAHSSYYFKNHMWVGINANWFGGGQTKVDNVPSGELLNNWRIGGTWSVPFSKSQSVKLQFHTGAFTNTGLDYRTITLVYQYAFF